MWLRGEARDETRGGSIKDRNCRFQLGVLGLSELVAFSGTGLLGL